MIKNDPKTYIRRSDLAEVPRNPRVGVAVGLANGERIFGCMHGVPWREHCIRCEKVSIEFLLNWMGPKVASARSRLDEINGLLSREGEQR